MLRLLNGLALFAWPFLVWLAMTYSQWHDVMVFAALLFAWRMWNLRDARGAMGRTLLLLASGGALLCLTSMILRSQHLLLWYPVGVNALLLLVFGRSLWRSMPLVERLARWREPDLPRHVIRYTWRVTQVWCGFFLVNGGVALVTCLHNDISLWTLWNGCISYLLMGMLMGGEWLLRQCIRNKV